MEKQRVYMVIDMKSFFASVECAERGLDAMTTKLVVADDTRTEKTICLAVSPALKAMGVKNRCRLYEVPKDKDIIIARPRMRKYIEYAANIYAIYLKYMDKSDIHVYSIDECILDVTDYLKMYKIKAKPFAQKLIKEIHETVGIPATAGIGSNMYLAKIALDITAKHAKDRIGWLTEEKFIKELWNHKPITDFWGISKGISTHLAKLGIVDMEGIAKYNEDLLYDHFGVNAELLIDHAWGKETCLMSDIKNYKSKSHSFSNSQILPRDYLVSEAKEVLKEMIQEGCFRLAREHVVTQLVHLYITYEGYQYGTKGTRRLSVTTNLYSQIWPYFDTLFDEIVDSRFRVRRIAYDFDCLVDDDNELYDMFTDFNKVEKEKRLTNSILQIKDKFGKNSIMKGTSYQPDAMQKERNMQIGGHRSGEEEDE